MFGFIVMGRALHIDLRCFARLCELAVILSVRTVLMVSVSEFVWGLQ